MADKKFVLAKIKVNEDIEDIVARSDGEHTTANYKGRSMTLDSALENVETDIQNIKTVFASDSEIREMFK